MDPKYGSGPPQDVPSRSAGQEEATASSSTSAQRQIIAHQTPSVLPIRQAYPATSPQVATRTNVWFQSPTAGSASPQSGSKPKKSVKHLECAYFYSPGGCKWSEEECLYAHRRTGHMADMPSIVEPGSKSIIEFSYIINADHQAFQSLYIKGHWSLLGLCSCEYLGQLVDRCPEDIPT